MDQGRRDFFKDLRKMHMNLSNPFFWEATLEDSNDLELQIEKNAEQKNDVTWEFLDFIKKIPFGETTYSRLNLRLVSDSKGFKAINLKNNTNMKLRMTFDGRLEVDLDGIWEEGSYLCFNTNEKKIEEV